MKFISITKTVYSEKSGISAMFYNFSWAVGSFPGPISKHNKCELLKWIKIEIDYTIVVHVFYVLMCLHCLNKILKLYYLQPVNFPPPPWGATVDSHEPCYCTIHVHCTVGHLGHKGRSKAIEAADQFTTTLERTSAASNSSFGQVNFSLGVIV